MKYTRKMLCLLSDTPLELFKGAAKSDDLPIDYTDPSAREGYAIYTPFDVILMALAREGSRPGYIQTGVSFATAAKIVRNNVGSVRIGIQRFAQGEMGYYIGYGTFVGADAGGMNVDSTFTGLQPAEFSRLFLIGVSQVIADVVARAAGLGIEFSADDAAAEPM